jgi:hypothetical protein
MDFGGRLWSPVKQLIILSRVTVDYIRLVLDWQLNLLDQTQLHTITVYTLHYSLLQLQLFSEDCCSARILTRNSLSKPHSRSIHLPLLAPFSMIQRSLLAPFSITFCCYMALGISLGPDPIGNIALALFSGQPFPSNAFFLSCLSSRYQVTSTPQAYMSQYITQRLIFLST